VVPVVVTTVDDVAQAVRELRAAQATLTAAVVGVQMAQLVLESRLRALGDIG
jgi:hypothetical protein